MYWNVLGRSRQIILKKIIQIMPVADSYLAGGTALALLFGHRKSFDFDWFTVHNFNPEDIYQKLSQAGKVKITETKEGTFHALLDDVQVSWLHYPNPLLAPLIKTKELPGLKLASLTDIALMKWAAISYRGARKDFIDLYIILQQESDLTLLVNLLPQKYPKAEINYYHMVKSLSHFEEAEREAAPKMITTLEWSAVKKYFLQQQKILLKKISLLPFDN